MRRIRIRYHRDGEHWWADSEDLPGWTAAGDSIQEIQALARSGAQEFAGEPVAIVEIDKTGDDLPRRSA